MLNARQIRFREEEHPGQLDHIKYLSAPVGSGKTAVVINDIRDALAEQSFIFVSPTIQLAQEVKNRLDVALVNQGQGENVHVVVTDPQEPLSVQQRVLNYINARRPNEHHVLIVTTETFRNVLPRIPAEQKRQYAVFMDEGIEAVAFAEFRTRNQRLFLEPIRVGDDDSLSIAPNSREILEAVVSGSARLAAMEREELAVPQYQEIAKFLVADIYDVYGAISERTIRVVAMLRPDEFLAFRSVTIIMAIFEQSLLALFWREKYGIVFEEYPSRQELFDTHQIKGRLLRIHYALHPNDNASAKNLKRNWQTGNTNELPASGDRVIDQIAGAVEDRFGDRPYCWAANGFFANAPRILTGERMPTQCAGLDVFKRNDTVVSLTCINPPPWVKNIIVQHIQITDGELYELWKLSHTYQTIGRCSLRDRQAEREIDVVVVSRDCADRIHGLFPGSEIIGQLADLPSYRAMGGGRGPARNRQTYTQADNQAWYRFRQSHPDYAGSKEDWYREYRDAE